MSVQTFSDVQDQLRRGRVRAARTAVAVPAGEVGKMYDRLVDCCGGAEKLADQLGVHPKRVKSSAESCLTRMIQIRAVNPVCWQGLVADVEAVVRCYDLEE